MTAPRRRRSSDTDENLLGEFIKAFGVLDELKFLPHMTRDGVLPKELDAGIDDSPYASPLWKPAELARDRRDLETIYHSIASRFPPLFERLVLSFCWLEVDLAGFVCLLANPPGDGLTPLLAQITADPVLAQVLLPLGFIPFGRASGDRYDPICFDTTRCLRDGDCPVVLIEHESVLCNGRIGESCQIADSFRSLVEAVIATAHSVKPD